MMDPVVFVDTETSGLDPTRHEVWDIAIIEANGTEHLWHFPLTHAADADPGALRVNRYHERTSAPGWVWGVHGKYISGWSHESTQRAAVDIAALTANKHLVGAVPDFDARFLGAFLRQNGQQEAWHYHLVDVETLLVGYLRGRMRRAGHPRSSTLDLPWKTSALFEAVGIDLSKFEAHTAIGDARLAKAVYEKVMAG